MSDENDDEGEIVKQLKEKFHLSTTKSEQVQVLTILLKSLSIRKGEEEFGASNYMARKAKKLMEDIMMCIDVTLLQYVVHFFLCD